MPPGEHVLQLGYTDANSRSITDARLRFTAVAGNVYEVRAARFKEGFWEELGKELKSELFSFQPAKGEWVAWMVDARSGAVLVGAAPTEGPFKTALPPP